MVYCVPNSSPAANPKDSKGRIEKRCSCHGAGKPHRDGGINPLHVTFLHQDLTCFGAQGLQSEEFETIRSVEKKFPYKKKERERERKTICVSANAFLKVKSFVNQP